VAFHPSQMIVLGEGLKGCHTLVEAADEAEAVLVAPRTPLQLDETEQRVLAAFREARLTWPEAYLAPDEADEVIREVKRQAADEGLASAIVSRALRRGLTGCERGVALRFVVAAIERDDAVTRYAA